MPFRDSHAVPGSLARQDPMHRFVALLQALEAERSWYHDRVPLRFAAIGVLTTPGEPQALAAEIRSRDAELAEHFGWFSQISPAIRLVLAAQLVKSDVDASTFAAEIDRVQPLFRAAGVRRGGAYEVLAVLVLHRVLAGAPVQPEHVARFKAIYEQMKRHHWFLTGPDDFPACAMLVGQTGAPEQIGDGVEAIYRALHRDADLTRGDPLQTAANVLYLTGLRPDEVSRRFSEIAQAFRAAKVKIGQAEYDEVAVLCFLAQPVARIVDTVCMLADGLRAELSWLSKPMAFSLGTSLAFVRLVGDDAELGPLAEAKLLLDMQTIVAARQAAAAATAGAA